MPRCRRRRDRYCKAFRHLYLSDLVLVRLELCTNTAYYYYYVLTSIFLVTIQIVETGYMRFPSVLSLEPYGHAIIAAGSVRPQPYASLGGPETSMCGDGCPTSQRRHALHDLSSFELILSFVYLQITKLSFSFLHRWRLVRDRVRPSPH